jgi:hypothetical protein
MRIEYNRWKFFNFCEDRITPTEVLIPIHPAVTHTGFPHCLVKIKIAPPPRPLLNATRPPSPPPGRPHRRLTTLTADRPCSHCRPTTPESAWSAAAKPHHRPASAPDPCSVETATSSTTSPATYCLVSVREEATAATTAARHPGPRPPLTAPFCLCSQVKALRYLCTSSFSP